MSKAFTLNHLTEGIKDRNNSAEGQRRSIVLAAQGEAEAILARARASAAAVEMLASATRVPGGDRAVALRVAEQYVSGGWQPARLRPVRPGPRPRACASSTELSTTSDTRGCRPRWPVEPMYMPGRLRTGSRPSSTVI